MKYIIAVVLAIIIVYLMGAFLSMETNPYYWPIEGRFGFITISLLFSAGAAGIVSPKEKQ